MALRFGSPYTTVRASVNVLNDCNSGGGANDPTGYCPISGWNQLKAGPSRHVPAYKILLLSVGKREACPSNLSWHFVINGRSSLRSPENIGGSGIFGSGECSCELREAVHNILVRMPYVDYVAFGGRQSSPPGGLLES